MNIREFHTMIDTHIARAKEKHPFFAHGLLDNDQSFDEYTKTAREANERDIKDGCCYADGLLWEEFCEFFAEVQKGNLTRAKEEAADAIAVIYRTIEMLEETQGDLK